jgi:hypothetical protein
MILLTGPIVCAVSGMTSTLSSIIAAFGSSARAKLRNPAMTGAPEDQLRAPFEALLVGLANLRGFPLDAVVGVGESTLHELKTRPEFA